MNERHVYTVARASTSGVRHVLHRELGAVIPSEESHPDFVEVPPMTPRVRYLILQDFASEHCPDLFDVIDGKGAFARARTFLEGRGLAGKWRRYHREAVRSHAVAFLTLHGFGD